MGWYFFFQAEDGIRAGHVTGVQTCALPISKDDLESVAMEAGSILSRHPSCPIVIKEIEKEHEIHLSATGMQPETPTEAEHRFEPYRGSKKILAETAVESYNYLDRQGGEYCHAPS